MSKIGVLGAGTWGTALSRVLCINGHEVSVWSALASEVDEFARTRRHPNLPGMEIPAGIEYTHSLEEVCTGKDIVLFAVPSVYIRSVAAQARPYLPDGQLIVSVAKGLESGSLFTMTQVIYDELRKDGQHEKVCMAALTGPTHAEEVALDQPTAIVAASSDPAAAKALQTAFMNGFFRVYTNSDIEGVQLCGAVKNVIALASGISSGLGYGDNARAALITRGMAEIARLGTAMGCLEQTFAGLAGMGDLIVTATSQHSRNNRCGFLIGQGMKTPDAVKEIGMVVEGINALGPVMEMAARYNIDMPIVQAADSIINHGEKPGEVVHNLMSREGRSESDKSPAETRYERAVLRGREQGKMKRIITYGTFDLLHYGHINLLRRAKALGDYLVVALSTDEFNWDQKQKKCYFSYEQRKALLEAIRYVDLVIPEENWDQKRSDVRTYGIDTFVIGDDWTGKFDFLKEEGVEVVYLPRTPEISTTQIKRDLHRDA